MFKRWKWIMGRRICRIIWWILKRRSKIPHSTSQVNKIKIKRTAIGISSILIHFLCCKCLWLHWKSKRVDYQLGTCLSSRPSQKPQSKTISIGVKQWMGHFKSWVLESLCEIAWNSWGHGRLWSYSPDEWSFPDDLIKKIEVRLCSHGDQYN